MTWTKKSTIELFLATQLPLEMIAKICSFIDGWCGPTEQDCYALLKHWEDYKPRKLQL